MSDRRFEERIAELEAEAAESEANAAKWAQESIDFESELTRTKSRLAEAEKERLLAGKAICSALGICHDYALSIPKIVADLDAQTYRRFVEANKEDAISARVRELEAAEKLALTTLNYIELCDVERNGGLLLESLGRVHQEAREYRAARALKGEA